MTLEQIEHGKAFMKALRENEKKATGMMRNADGGRCCLCVALDVAVERGYDPDGLSRRNFSDLNMVPPPDMGEFYGWGHVSNPRLIDDNNIEADAAPFNDGREQTDEYIIAIGERTHKEIADIFENTFPEYKQ